MTIIDEYTFVGRLAEISAGLGRRRLLDEAWRDDAVKICVGDTHFESRGATQGVVVFACAGSTCLNILAARRSARAPASRSGEHAMGEPF